MKDFFDRKTFDPMNNADDKRTLSTLRTMGSHRLVLARGGHLRARARSTAMRWALKSNKESGVFLDLGCGNSGDTLVATKLGFAANGLDLFPPADFPEKDYSNFIQTDVAERIPFSDAVADLIVSQAMLDLIEPVAREQFFREVDRVLKPGGVFACFIQRLQPGWGVDIPEEQERAAKVWPGQIKNKSGGFVVTKESIYE